MNKDSALWPLLALILLLAFGPPGILWLVRVWNYFAPYGGFWS